VEYKIDRDTANITTVLKGSPSYRSGIKKDDKIISVDDDNIAGVSLTQIEVNEILLGMEGSNVKLTVMRNGKLEDFTMSREQFLSSKSTMGIEFEIKGDTVYITRVEAGSAAEQSGLIPGDKLMEISGKPVTGAHLSENEVTEALDNPEIPDVEIMVVREGKIHEYTFLIEELLDDHNSLGIEFEIQQDTVYITHVKPGSSLAKSGIKAGDMLIGIGERTLSGASKSENEIQKVLNDPVSSDIKITVMRDGVLQNYTVSREELFKSKELIGMDYEIRQDTVYITRISPGGKADKMGIRVGDKLVEIGEESVSGMNVSEGRISQSLSKVVEKGAVVTVLRNGVEHEYFISSEDLDESERAGIGIKFEIRNDSVYVTKIMEGGSAGTFGLLEGDQIIKIDGINVAGTNVTDVEVSNKLSGDEGTAVSLSILRNGEEQELVGERGIIQSGLNIERSTQVIGVHHLKSLEDIKGVKVFFNTFRADNNEDVQGRIEIINPDKPQRFALEEAHSVVGIPLSINRSGNVELICEIFGYKKIQHDFNLNNPMTERSEPYLSHEQGVLIVDFELNRYTRGDLVTMYNVYFYKDAAIMRPESKYELQQLIEMLNENPDYKISIMGHTNGNNSGPIIEMAEGSVNYFSNAGQKKEGWGSAKKLSSKRAELIMEYLVSQNINSNRMEAAGYGGKKSIYDKFDNLAYKNVRVEIEILAD